MRRISNQLESREVQHRLVLSGRRRSLNFPFQITEKVKQNETWITGQKIKKPYDVKDNDEWITFDTVRENDVKCNQFKWFHHQKRNCESSNERSNSGHCDKNIAACAMCNDMLETTATTEASLGSSASSLACDFLDDGSLEVSSESIVNHNSNERHSNQSLNESFNNSFNHKIQPKHYMVELDEIETSHNMHSDEDSLDPDDFSVESVDEMQSSLHFDLEQDMRLIL